MQIKFILVLCLFFKISISFSQDSETNGSQLSNINDGPYVSIKKDAIIETKIINGDVITKEISNGTYDTIYKPEKSVFKGVQKIAALSDIHGQYDLAIEILINNNIIDKSLNWSFGNGHFVIVGDVFDRGDEVLEMLWLIFNLEKQAEKVGGKVHYLLGNHEYMVLHKDLRYLHEKYKQTSKILNIDYDKLFGNDTVLGRWLRSKSTIVKLNDQIFVHGGVSKAFLKDQDFELEKINSIMRNSIDKSKEEMNSTDFYEKYYGLNSLIWYRGYFQDDLPNTEIVELLDMMNSKQIVVGHCSNDTVVSLCNNKIFGVDSSIKKGRYGEILFIEGDTFSAGTKDGTRRVLY